MHLFVSGGGQRMNGSTGQPHPRHRHALIPRLGSGNNFALFAPRDFMQKQCLECSRQPPSLCLISASPQMGGGGGYYDSKEMLQHAVG